MMIGPQQRKVIVKFGVAILALLVIFGSYSYVIPRTEVEVETVYHSSYSALFVQSKLSNTGNKQSYKLIIININPTKKAKKTTVENDRPR